MTYSSLLGLILVVIGAFVGFTFSSTFIDPDHKRIRYSNNIFGIIRTGSWVTIEPSMRLGVIRSGTTWVTYSRSNRAIDIDQNDFRIVLYDSEDRQIMHVKKFNSIEAAETELKTLAVQMGLDKN